MSDENKVVQFPSHKVKKASKEQGQTFGQEDKSSRRRVMLAISILATVLTATIINNKMNQHTGDGLRQVGDRVLASAQSERRSLEDDILLAKKISSESLREPASSGRQPTAEDLLRDGELAGLYSLKFNDQGALNSLIYAVEPGKERYLNNRGEFLKRYADLLRVDFETAKLTESIGETTDGNKDPKYKLEVYDLVSNTQKVTARVHFKVGLADQLYSMSVERL